MLQKFAKRQSVCYNIIVKIQEEEYKMNLAETKKALEEGVKKALLQSLEQGVDVNTSYDANEGKMYASLARATTKEKEQNITIYNMCFNESDKNLSVAAYSRIIITDNYGPAYTETRPVNIDNRFFTDMVTIFSIGLDMGYNPERYAAAEAEAEGANEDPQSDSQPQPEE